jgi:hypothetical protein
MRTAGAMLMLLGCLGCLSPVSAADEFAIVKPSIIQVDGQDQNEAKLFTNAEKKVFYVCIQGDANLYEVDRQGKKVCALKRSSVMVMPEKCRPIDGAAVRPIEGHLYKDTDTGFNFNALSGKKITVNLPAGKR